MFQKQLKIVLFVLAVALTLGAAGFVAWASDASQPQQAALTALQSDETVTVTDHGDYISFEPVGVQATTGFVFYPGGRVDYRAYAPALKLIAAQGYFVALVPVNLNLAFFDTNAAAPVIDSNPQVMAWAVGGHSLGGVAASIFAPTNPKIAGLVFWASFPAGDSLRDSNLQILSIFGTLDALAAPHDIENSRILLPDSTLFVPIEGGNHAQFGDYGPQAGDSPASISPEEQWQQAADATVSLLASLAPVE